MEVSSSVGGLRFFDKNYLPPEFEYKDADEVTVVIGDYPALGHRVRGRGYVLSGLNQATIWQLESPVDVDVDVAGTLIGAKSSGGTGSWYSLFMLGTSTFLVLPFVRVDAISESGGVTTINPAAHDDGTTADDSFITEDDVFNGYRLAYISFDSNNGTVWEISDTVDGSPDEIKVAEDITSIVSAGDALQMIPSSSVEYLYLGALRIDNAGDLEQFWKRGEETYRAYVTVNGTTSQTPANTELGKLIPPTATKILMNAYFSSQATAVTLVTFYTYWGSSGTDIQRKYQHQPNYERSYLLARMHADTVLSIVSKLRNAGEMYDPNSMVDIDTVWLEGSGWCE